jgi:hypothetical protein
MNEGLNERLVTSYRQTVARVERSHEIMNWAFGLRCAAEAGLVRWRRTTSMESAHGVGGQPEVTGGFPEAHTRP